MGAREDFIAAQKRLLARVGLAAESRFVEVDSVSGPAHVLVAGDGPPVVMVPGFGDPAAMWAPLMAELGGFTVYAVDRPCFGLTAPARHTTATIRTLAVDFLDQVLESLGLQRPAFVANSIGSLWTIWLALDRPERVAAMVHIGCPAFLLDTSAPLPMRLISIPPLGRFLMKLTPPSARQVEQFASMAGEDFSTLPEMTDLLVEMQKLPGARAAMRELLHAVVRLRGARPEVALTADHLTPITQPVQLIWGERDPFGAVSVGERAPALIPDAELHVVPGGGHVPWVIHSSAVAELAEPFLRRAA
jgi:pimeloyl-ACP methyl ester carboxylesterase